MGSERAGVHERAVDYPDVEAPDHSPLRGVGGQLLRDGVFLDQPRQQPLGEESHQRAVVVFSARSKLPIRRITQAVWRPQTELDDSC